MSKMVVTDANNIVGKIAYLFSEVASIYPITPSSPMASKVDELKCKGEKNLFNSEVKVVEMQSEAGAAGTMHGALISGSLASTFTASQGLLLMIPNMYKIAGEMLPGVMHVASRTVATHGLSIFGDHSDIYATRDTGFCMLASSNVFEAEFMAAISHLSAINSSLPFLHFFDGFRTSHELNKVLEIDEKELLKLVDYEKLKEFKDKALNLNCGFQRGLAYNDDIYYQCVIGREKYYKNVIDVVKNNMDALNKVCGTDYKPFNYYGAEDATDIIIAIGSVTDTIKEVVKDLNNKGKKYGVVVVHLYRPFSSDLLMSVIPKTVRRIAVLDRTRELGSSGEPLYLDVVNALKEADITIVGGVYGLSSKDTTPKDIYSVYKMLEDKPKERFSLSIIDDENYSSLDEYDYELVSNFKEVKIYGYGSDGMVSSSKSILNTIANNSSDYVQGYFEYDSKKSGGVTISHLRFSEDEIHAPYYISKPMIVVVTKDNYFKKFNIIKEIRKNGVLLINTESSDIDSLIDKDDAKYIKDNNIKVLFVNASSLANKAGIKGKISKIMEVIILRLLGFTNALDLTLKTLEKFRTKGEDIINANEKAMSMALESVREVSKELFGSESVTSGNSVYEVINKREGNSLTVSNLAGYETGKFSMGTSKQDKRCIANMVPKWNKENCIECGFCSIVCPHAVIRPIVSKNNDNAIPLFSNKEYGYEIVVSESDCTGCGLCVKTCPGKDGKKALTFGPYDEKRAEYAKKLYEYENPKVMNKFTVPGSQMEKCRFCFSGACAGCGETPYIKLLTQLFGKEIVIANATGCSSIYGGSIPSMPYTIPWANSLFEDNAEFAYGMHITYEDKKEQNRNILENSKDSVTLEVKELYTKWLENSNDYEITNEVKNALKNKEIPNDLKPLLSYMPHRTVWALGGDGWAYDIGFGGIDHVLSTNANIKVLVLDTEVYSNTGGQASKSSHLGQVAEFANLGKKTYKKDLFRIAMGYPNCYVASIALGSNFMQAIKAFKEAMEHEGPAIIIAYSPCIEQGIKGGMINAVEEEKLSVECGYNILMRYIPDTKNLVIDSKEPDFTKYEDFLNNEVRYNALKIKDENLAKELLNEEIEYAKERYKYYKRFDENEEKLGV